MGETFGMGRGIMQGNPASIMILNIVFNVVFRVVLEEVCGPQEAHHGMGWAAGGRQCRDCRERFQGVAKGTDGDG